MRFFNRVTIVFVSVGVACVLAAAFFIPQVFFVLHALVDIFAGGRSGVKVFLFFGYLLLLYSILALVWNKQPQREQRSLAKIVFALTLLLFVFGLVSQIDFFVRYDIPWRQMAIVFNNGEISSTRLLHSHIFKGIVGSLLKLFGTGAYENVDAGLPYVGLVPMPYFLVGALLFLCTLFLHLYYFCKAVPRQGTLWRILIFVLAYALCSFVLLKNSMDGGLFNTETGSAFAAFALLIFWQSKWSKKVVVVTVATYLLVFTVLYLLGAFTNILSYATYIYHMLALLAVFSFFIWVVQEKEILRLHLLLGLLCALLLVPFLNTDLALWSYRQIKVPIEDGALVATYKPIGSSLYTLQNSLGDLRLYKYMPTKETAVGDILRNNSLLDNLHPIAIPWRDCFPVGQSVDYTFTLQSKAPLTTLFYENAGMVRVTASFTGTKKNVWSVYRVTAEVAPCMPRHANILQEALYFMGGRTFVVTNFEGE